MNKKLLSAFFIGLLIMVLTACGGEQADSESEAASDSSGEATSEKLTAPDRFLRIGSGPMGSGWYPITTSLSEIYMEGFENLNASQLEGGSVSNLKAMEIGDIEYSINYTSDFVDALNGTAEFDQALSTPAGLASIYPVYQTIATLAENNDINTIEDIISKHIFLGPQNGGGPVSFWRMMAEYGYDEEAIRQAGGRISYGNYSDGATMLTDGNVDVFVAGGAPQVTALQEIELTREVKILPIEQDKLESLADRGFGISFDSIPAGSYKGQDEEIPTYTLVTMLTVSNNLDKDYVYNLTKMFWDNMAEFEKSVPARAENFTLDTALDGIEAEQLHPGAKRYYEEVGALN
ncbi:TAXI family TRAP transporter solute-binding subunit [Alkalihalobacillus deserti]|uniref:TAXI family TRAP transporter solute-binding subunit n=1 Tax=Alkalihalobacillus deserti TaxID=2879466 RepID=UPI001D14122F|nr:TAXI family TRAP transporter solute-binding subunit [Alkalihalobacillus deserti]